MVASDAREASSGIENGAGKVAPKEAIEGSSGTGGGGCDGCSGAEATRFTSGVLAAA